MEKYTQPENLEKYSFLWSEARLAIAAVALFIGGYPPLLAYNPVLGLTPLLGMILKLSWIISGLASAYMIYRWNQNGMMLFGKKMDMDRYAFFVSVISGINLGITGLLGRNIGMSISTNYFLFIIVAIIYIITAGYLWREWKKAGKRVF